MPGQDERTLAALRLLLHTSHLAGPDALPSLASEAGRLLGAERTVVYVVDYDQVVLVPLLADDEPPQQPVAVEGTAPGLAYRDVQPSSPKPLAASLSGHHWSTAPRASACSSCCSRRRWHPATTSSPRCRRSPRCSAS